MKIIVIRVDVSQNQFPLVENKLQFLPNSICSFHSIISFTRKPRAIDKGLK